MKKEDIKSLDFQKMGGVIPVVIQDEITGRVLMLGFMNKEALKKTLRSKKVIFWSRTKKRLWKKGETSGNSLRVMSVASDCDRDTLLIKVKPKGPTCHKGKMSCFDPPEGAIGQTRLQGMRINILSDLFSLIIQRKKDLPKGSYTASLFKAGLPQICAKVLEESVEVIQAARKETRKRVIEESADLLYHLIVLLVNKNIDLTDIARELKKRLHSSLNCTRLHP